MRNRKKLTAVLLTAAMALSLAACGGGKEETKAPETKAAQESKAEEPAQTKAEGKNRFHRKLFSGEKMYADFLCYNYEPASGYGASYPIPEL